MKISNQIDQLTQLVASTQWAEADAVCQLLMARKLTKAQRAITEDLESTISDNYEQPAYTMSNQLAKYRSGYVVSITADGAKSLSNGDEVTQFLEAKTWEAVCALADDATGNPVGFHAERYARLNPGQRRMNSGNRLRALYKKGEWKIPA